MADTGMEAADFEEQDETQHDAQYYEDFYEEEERPASAPHYTSARQVPKKLKKYWNARYDIFARFDDGVWLTKTGWYSVTPEPVADRIAFDLAAKAPAEIRVIIDPFAGVGGNAIAFARSGRWDRVIAIEKDPDTLKCAIHNAAIYGVMDQITWYEGNCFNVLRDQLSTLGKDPVVFASPPWGGPGYTQDRIFNLSTMQPYSLEKLHRRFSRITENIAMYLPRSSDLRQIEPYAEDGRTIQVTHYLVRGASKAICAYFGGLRE